MEYRRKIRSDVWHWVKACRNFPQAGHILVREIPNRPSTGGLCDECRVKELRARR
jgi:hypothetical protein